MEMTSEILKVDQGLPKYKLIQDISKEPHTKLGDAGLIISQVIALTSFHTALS